MSNKLGAVPADLREVFESTLIPHLATRPGPWALGPTFTGSALIGGADADLIAAGLLLDLKVKLGTKRKDGTRSPTLDKADLYQLLGYALLDFDNDHHITELAIFDARYAHLATWPLTDLLHETAGHPVDLATTRTQFQQLLQRQRGKATGQRSLA